MCVVLCIATLTFSISVFADDEPTPTPTAPPIEDLEYTPAETLWQNAGVEALWILLNAWGIRITYGDTQEFTEEVRNTMENLVIEYLDSLPSPMSIFSWCQPWLWSVDFWGNARFNESMLEDVESFANWLITKFSLVDDSQEVLNPVYTANGAQLYESNTYYRSESYEKDGISYIAMSRSSDFQSSGTKTPYWFVLYNPTLDYWYFIFIRPVGSSYELPHYFLGLDIGGNEGWISSDSRSWDGITKFGYEFCFVNPYPNGYSYNNPNLPLNTTYLSFSNDGVGWNYLYRFVNSLSEFNIVMEGDTKIVTTAINLPAENPDYTAGDSVTIVDGQPVYVTIDWSSEVTVSNLPAIVSTGSIPVPGDTLNPGMISAYRPISSFINMASDTMRLMTGIIYEFPEEVIIPIYAIMGGMILFGVIKLMREH